MGDEPTHKGTMMSEKILEALKRLDPTVDGHWTSDGLPAVEVVKQETGDSSLTRKIITDAAPDFKRVTAGDYKPTPDPEGDDQPVDDDGKPVAVAATAALAKALDAIEPVPAPEAQDAAVAKLEAELPVATLAELDQRLQELDQYVYKLGVIRTKIMAAQDAFHVALPAPEPHSVVVQQWLARQKAEREGKAATDAAIKSVLGKDPLTVRSSIDAAMAAKRGFGQNRPNYAAPK